MVATSLPSKGVVAQNDVYVACERNKKTNKRKSFQIW